MNLLIIDDDTRRADSLKAHLVHRGFDGATIEIADSADAGRALLRERYFDALVLDVVLPRRRGDRNRSAEVGLDLLKQLARSNRLRKPERIIGITAHCDDIASFKQHFEQWCYAVIEAPGAQSVWRDTIADSLGYTIASKMTRRSIDGRLRFVTVHGIRTNGSWQARLQNLVARHTDRAVFFEYKYGNFSTIRFLVPSLRRKELDKLRSHVFLPGIGDGSTETVVICHSFGTYLVAETLRALVQNAAELPRLTLVLCGSVLRADYDWSFLPANVRVVNECGARDYVLLLSEAFAPGLGMAGKVGFLGFNSSRFMNRYYDGGHSLYFASDDFMAVNWLPLLTTDWDKPRHVDERRAPGFLAAIAESTAVAIGGFKDLVFR